MIVVIILLIFNAVCWKSKKCASRKKAKKVVQDVIRPRKFEIIKDHVNSSYNRETSINILDFTDGVELPKYPLQ